MANTEFLSIIQGLRAQLDLLEAQVTGGHVVAVPSALKPKKVLSPEHLAKMAAGRKAAAERRLVDKAAGEAEEASSDAETKLEAEAKPKPKRTLTDEQKAKMAAGRKAATELRKAAEESGALIPKSVKGKKILWNKVTDACYKRIGESEQGDYLGVLKDGSIDSSVAE